MLNGLRSVFVVDETHCLVGILTDGDIRGGILKNVNIDLSVRVLMNSNPMVLTERKSPEEVHRIMMKTSYMILPLVNEQNQVVDFYHLKEISEQIFPSFSHGQTGLSKSSVKGGRILVIGGAGYIGSILSRELLRNGYAVRVFDSLLYGKNSISEIMTDPRFEFIRGDVRNVESLMGAIKDVNAVVHLGEIVGDPACSLDDNFTIDVNFLATKTIADICSIYRIPRLIFVSSCSVYGIGEGVLTEESPVNPVSLYAKCKIESEKVILSQAKDACHPTILRLSTVFGASPRPRFDLVVNLLTAKAILEKEISIFGGDQWRPFIGVSDVARAILGVLEAETESVRAQIFNVGDESLNYRIVQIGEILKEIYPQINVNIREDMEDKRNYRVSFKKIKDVLEFTCKTDLRQGIGEIAKMIEEKGISDYQNRIFSNHRMLAG